MTVRADPWGTGLDTIGLDWGGGAGDRLRSEGRHTWIAPP